MSKMKGPAKPTKGKGAKSTKASAIAMWFSTHNRWLTYSTLGIAVILRVLFWLEMPKMPISELHHAKDLDMEFFDQWGDRIAKGDVWTDTIWHPFHSWHMELAKGFGITDETAAKVKWGEWYGGKRYHQEPLYPLLIGAAKVISDHGRQIIYLLQMLLSVVSIWMVIWLGRHYFHPMAGILGGLLFTLYAPSLIFDATLLRTSFSTSLFLGYLVVAEQLMQGKGKPWLMGLLGGAGYLLMTTSILLWLPLVIRWLYCRREDLRKAWQVVVVFCLFLSFLMIRNSITGSPLLSSSSVGPITYILSNFKEFKPELGFVWFQQGGKILEQSHGKMMDAVQLMIDQNGSVLKWMWLQLKKFAFVFHWYEISNNVNTYLATVFSTTLKFLFIPYSLIAGLGLTGLLISIKNKKSINLIIGIISQVAVMVLFYVLCRFRVPMTAMLCVYAGYTLYHLFAGPVTWRTGTTIVCAIALWLIILRPEPYIGARYTRGDLATMFHAYYLPKLEKLRGEQQIAECIELFESFLTTMPDYVRDESQWRTLKTTTEKDVVYYYGLLYGDLAGLYQEIGNTAKAEECKAKEERMRGM